MSNKIQHFTQNTFELESFKAILAEIFPQIHFIEPTIKELQGDRLKSQTTIAKPFKIGHKDFGVYIFECDSIRAKVGIHTELKGILKDTGLSAILAIFHTHTKDYNIAPSPIAINCHTERSEVSQTHNKEIFHYAQNDKEISRDMSAFSKSQNDKEIDSPSFAHGNSTLSPSIAEGVQGGVSSLRASEASVAIQNQNIDCNEVVPTSRNDGQDTSAKDNASKEFRLSLITSGYDFEANQPTFSNLKRQSFILGHSKTATANKALASLIQKAQRAKAQKSQITQKDLEEAFSKEPINKAFYKEIITQYLEILEHSHFPTHASEYDKRSFVLRLLCRILFCKFLEKKGIVDCAIWDIALSENYYHEVLEPLFFTTLNTPRESRDYDFLPEPITHLLHAIPYLNGGLFSPQDNDFFSTQSPNAFIHTLHIPNALFANLFALLDSYSFTLDEQSHNDCEVALDPELLGTVFESLLSQLFTDNKVEKLDKNTLRKATGSYYTPREIVRYMVKSAILAHLQTKLKGKVDCASLESLVFESSPSLVDGDTGVGNHLSLRDLPKASRGNLKSCHCEGGKATEESKNQTTLCHTEGKARSISNSKNRDSSLPAETQNDKNIDCHESRCDSRNDEQTTQLILAELNNIKILDPACGSGAFPMGILNEIIRIQNDLGDTRPPYRRKLEILQNCIYGVDIQPMATEIARLRCFLSLIIDEDLSLDKDDKDPSPLPNLEFKFISANSLLPLQTTLQDSQGRQLGSDIYEKGLNELQQIRTETFTSHDKIALQSKYKSTIDKIAKNLFFQAQGETPLTKWNPFDPHSIAQFFDSAYMFGIDCFDIIIGNPPYGAKINETQKQKFKNAYKYATQGSLDTYKLFIEKGFDLLAQNGNLSYIVPLSVTSSKSNTQLHQMLLDNCAWIEVSSYGDRPAKIFGNAEQKVSIISFAKTLTHCKELMTTWVNKRTAIQSIQSVLQNLHFINSIDFVREGAFCKISLPIEKSIMQKLYAKKHTLKDIMNGDERIYYRTSGNRYYNLFTNYSTESSKEKFFEINDSNAMVALMTSNLFYWFRNAYSNQRDSYMYEFERFPITNFSKQILANLVKLGKKLQADIESKANFTSTGTKEYRLRKSKHIIDEIDRLICPLYDLTQEETDFIINYDIAFRTD